jgi:hypothetical protein
MPPLPPSPAATAATGCRCCRYRLLQPRHSRRHRLPQPPPAAAATITGRRSRSHQPLQQRHSRSRADADTTAGRRQHRRRPTPTLASPDAAATRITATAALKAKLDALIKDAKEAEEKAVAARRRARAARTLLEEEEQGARDTQASSLFLFLLS